MHDKPLAECVVCDADGNPFILPHNVVRLISNSNNSSQFWHCSAVLHTQLIYTSHYKRRKIDKLTYKQNASADAKYITRPLNRRTKKWFALLKCGHLKTAQSILCKDTISKWHACASQHSRKFIFPSEWLSIRSNKLPFAVGSRFTIHSH